MLNRLEPTRGCSKTKTATAPIPFLPRILFSCSANRHKDAQIFDFSLEFSCYFFNSEYTYAVILETGNWEQNDSKRLAAQQVFLFSPFLFLE